MSNNTDVKRQQRRRDRLQAAGFTQRTIWVHKVDQDRFDDFKDTLTRPEVFSDAADRPIKQS